MGRRTTRGRRPPEPGRPSWFFIIALLIGVILLFWGAAVALRKPAPMKTGVFYSSSSSAS